MLQAPSLAAVCVWLYFPVLCSVLALLQACSQVVFWDLPGVWGGWIAGNARDQGKARTACKGQQMVVKGGWKRWKKSQGVTEWFETVWERTKGKIWWCYVIRDFVASCPYVHSQRCKRSCPNSSYSTQLLEFHCSAATWEVLLYASRIILTSKFCF